MFPVDRIRNYKIRWGKLSEGRKNEISMGLLVIFGSTPFLLYIGELPIFLPDTVISDVSAILTATILPVIGLATRIKLRNLRTRAVGVGFIGLFLSAFSLFQSKMETAYKILSTDVTTLDFKLAAITFTFAVTITAIGLIRGMQSRELPEDTEPMRYA
jgi:hypothetical protein